MFFRYDLLWVVILCFLSPLPGLMFRVNTTETNAVLTMIDNPVRGKTYWLYAEKQNWTQAIETCAENGQELIQLPTKDEQEWVMKNMADYKYYWVGMITFGDRFFWKVPNGKIPVDMKRFFTLIQTDSQYGAHEDHLHPMKRTQNNHVICQQEYSQKKGNFANLSGKYQFGQKIKQFVGGKFQCASKCMMLVRCKAFLLDYRKGFCQIYGWFAMSKLKEEAIDCNSLSKDCFTRGGSA